MKSNYLIKLILSSACCLLATQPMTIASTDEITEPAQATKTIYRSLDPASLSCRNLFEEIMMNDSKVANFTLHGLDHIAALVQGVVAPYDIVIKELHPYTLFTCLNGSTLPESIKNMPHFPLGEASNSVVQVFVFFAEAFGKNINPVYLYATRDKILNDPFQSVKNVQKIFAAFKEKDERILKCKFKEITTVTNLKIARNFSNPLFSSLPDGYKFFADFGMMHAQFHYGGMLCTGNDIDKNPLRAIHAFEMAAKSDDPELRDKAKRNLPESQLLYGLMLINGDDGLKPDPLKAISYLNKVIQSEYATLNAQDQAQKYLYVAHSRYAQILSDPDGGKQDLPQAIQYFEKAAESDNAEVKNLAKCSLSIAQYHYGTMFLKGNGVEKDLLKAIRYFKMAAESKDSEMKDRAKINICKAQINYGKMLFDGNGVKQNHLEAIRYFEMAAESDDPKLKQDAKYNLCLVQHHYGVMLSKVYGAENSLKAIRYFEMAAESSDIELKAQAKHNLAITQFYYGNMLLDGKGIDKNPLEAIRYFKMAAESEYTEQKAGAKNNLAIAQYKYGIMLLNGDGIETNPLEAIRYLEMAAEIKDTKLKTQAKNNLAIAQNNYGVFFLNGKGVEKNPLEAIRYFKMAAESEDSEVEDLAKLNISKAQNNYGFMLLNGDGIQENRFEATVYFIRAARQGNLNALKVMHQFMPETWAAPDEPASIVINSEELTPQRQTPQ